MCARQRTHFLLLRQEKVSKEKASRIRRPCGYAALLGTGGRLRISTCGLRHLRLFSRRSLRYSPPHNGMGTQTAEDRTAESQQGRAIARPCGVGYSGSPAVMRRRVAQGQPDQGWRCLSEASLARPRLHRATQRARSAAKGRRIRLAFLLGTLLWRSKEKYLARRGETRQSHACCNAMEKKQSSR